MKYSFLSLISVSFLAVASTISFSSCSHSDHENFTLIQDKPKIVSVDLGDRGLSRGDKIYFEANLTLNRRKVGIVLGELVVRGLFPHKAESVLAQQSNGTELDFHLEKGDIIALGVTEVARSSWKIKPNQPSTRVIVGGTGEYAGVHGNLITTRREDSTFVHEFKFIQ